MTDYPCPSHHIFAYSSRAYQLGEEDMEGYIAGGGEDAWTGFLSTARHAA